MNDESQISSMLSTLFLNDFELPDLNEVKGLISCKHKENVNFDNGWDSLTDIICALLLQKTQFFRICHSGQNRASVAFAKKYSYQGELLDKNMTLAAIELVLKQDELLTGENVQRIVDYQKCVVLFNQTKRLSCAFDFIQELFEIVYEFDNELLTLSEEKKIIHSKIMKMKKVDNELLTPSEEKKIINSKIMKMKKGLDEVDRKVVVRSLRVPDFHEAVERHYNCEYGCDVFDGGE